MDMRKIVFNALGVEGDYKSHGRCSRLLLSESKTGTKGFAMGLNVTAAGGMSPVHVHEIESEGMYIISGTGKAILDGEEIDVGPDSVVFAPPGVSHGFRNTGDGDFKFLWVYCPPLPSQK